MVTGEAIPTVRRKYQTLSRIMDERMRRRWAASEAIALGWGGITAVAEATGLSPTTIRAGITECRTPELHSPKTDSCQATSLSTRSSRCRIFSGSGQRPQHC
jgi:hypothetical protein